MKTETPHILPSRRNRVQRIGSSVTKRFLSQDDCSVERNVYQMLDGTGLAPALIEANESRIVTEYLDGPLFFDELEKALDDPDRQSELFDLFFHWSDMFYRRTGLILGDSNFRNFILAKDRLFGLDFETSRPGCPAEDIAWQAAMLASLRPAFSPERIRTTRRFLARAPKSIYGDPQEILSFLPEAFRVICERRETLLDATAYGLIESTLEVTACVLAGGRSSRMGKDKRSLSLQGTSFLEAAQLTIELYSDKYLSLSTEDPMIARPGFEIERDTIEAAGPIAGITRVLHAARQPWILFLPCDMPLLHIPLLDELVRHRRSDTDAVFFSEKGELRIFPLLLRTAAAAPVFEAALVKGDLKLRRILEKHLRTEAIEATDCGCYQDHALSNINTMDEYERLQDIAQTK